MATFSKQLLSGSSGGRGIKVVATASTGTTIHTTGTSATIIDEIHLFATNSDIVPVTLTIQFGGTTAVDDDIVLGIPSKSGLTYVIPGLPLSGTGSAARTVTAYAGTASKVVLHGHVHRIA